MLGSTCNRYLSTRGFNVKFYAKTPLAISGFSGFPRSSWQVRNPTFSFFLENFFAILLRKAQSIQKHPRLYSEPSKTTLKNVKNQKIEKSQKKVVFGGP